VEDNLIIRGMTYKDFIKKKEEAEKKKKAIDKVTMLKEVLTEEELLFFSRLVEYFYQEVSVRTYNDFLQDHSYTDEEYVRIMSKMKRL
jgi:hypothetical protein